MSEIAVRKIHHVGIAVEKLSRAYEFYRETLGLPLVKEAEVKDQKVRAALLAAGESEIELLEPTAAGSGIGKFLEKRGEGLHHLCFETEDVSSALRGLKAAGIALIDETPREGLAGRIGFLHPRACAGVLVELATPLTRFAGETSPVRFQRVVIAARDPQGTARLFQDLFALSEQSTSGGRASCFRWVGGPCLSSPPTTRGAWRGWWPSPWWPTISGRSARASALPEPPC